MKQEQPVTPQQETAPQQEIAPQQGQSLDIFVFGQKIEERRYGAS